MEQLCQEIEGVWPANYNCPGQIVVSGENAAVDRLIEEATAAGARKTVKLRVGGAFHSPLVGRAADRLRPALDLEGDERAHAVARPLSVSSRSMSSSAGYEM